MTNKLTTLGRERLMTRKTGVHMIRNVSTALQEALQEDICPFPLQLSFLPTYQIQRGNGRTNLL